LFSIESHSNSGAKIDHFTLDAVRTARGATFPSVPDQQVREINPIFARHDPHESALNLLGRRFPGQSHASREPRDVRVHDQALSFAVGDAQHYVCRLASNAIKLNEFVKSVRNFAVVFLSDCFAAVANRAGLVPEKPGTANQGFQLRRVGIGKIRSGAILLKQSRCHQIDPGISALGAENGRDEELQRIFVVQSAPGIGIASAQATQNFPTTFLHFALGNIHGSQYSIRSRRAQFHRECFNEKQEIAKMAYVVCEPCVGCKYTDCVEVCPVNCFYEIDDRLYIHPDECIDCTACVPVCPVEAIFAEGDVPEKWKSFIAENREKVSTGANITAKKDALGKDKPECAPGARKP
jgi:ferredoxin